MDAWSLEPLVAGVLVAQSRLYATNTTVVVSGDRALLVDPGVLVDELSALAVELACRGLSVEAGVATHWHWDHVLWASDLGDAVRYASPKTVELVTDQRERLLAELPAGSYKRDLVGRPLQALDAPEVPWSGPTAEVIVHDAHAPGHLALWFPDTGVLVAGDLLSDVELPLLDPEQPGALAAYREGLDRVTAGRDVRRLVPGHGSVADGREYRRRLDADRRYLDALAADRTLTAADEPRLAHRDVAEAHAANVTLARA